MLSLNYSSHISTRIQALVKSVPKVINHPLEQGPQSASLTNSIKMGDMHKKPGNQDRKWNTCCFILELPPSATGTGWLGTGIDSLVKTSSKYRVRKQPIYRAGEEGGRKEDAP
jgi:hypothetical protein